MTVFYLLATILVVLNAFFLALNIVGLPGNWLMIICTLLFAWWQGPNLPGGVIGVPTLVALVVLGVVGEVLELVAGAAGSRQAGGSRRGSLGALMGGVVGGIAATFLIPIPVIGSLIGACGGAFLGALGMELTTGRDMAASIRSGIGAGKGRLVGTVVKIATGGVIWLLAGIALFWP